jgi:hypothetical protein
MSGNNTVLPSAPPKGGAFGLYCYSKGKPSLQWAKESAMTAKFEDRCLGVATSTQGILSVWSRIYKDGRSPSLIVRDGLDVYCVVKEIPVMVRGSLTTLAINAFETMSYNQGLIAKMNAM